MLLYDVSYADSPLYVPSHSVCATKVGLMFLENKKQKTEAVHVDVDDT